MIFTFIRESGIVKKLRKCRSKDPESSEPSIKPIVSRMQSMETIGTEENRPRRRRDRIKIDLLIHDFKVPLAVIEAGITSLFRRPEKYGELTEEQQRVLQRSLRNIKVIQTLVNDALEVGRSREGIINCTTFSLSSLIVHSLVEIFDLTHGRTSERITVCTDLNELQRNLEDQDILLSIDEPLWHAQVCLDEGKLKQILRNLLSNALKYRRSRVELRVEKTEGFLIFSVKDDGEGIPAVFHEKIFESYFQMDSTDVYTVRGHGLGLAGVMVLVEDMGCSLQLESDQGKGATFHVKIPLSIEG